jgi:hypothetical protein
MPYPTNLLTHGYAVGDTVKFATPLDTNEANERFTVLELRGPRALVQLQCNSALAPTFSYYADELTRAQ